jgi:DNA topoisomerase III
MGEDEDDPQPEEKEVEEKETPTQKVIDFQWSRRKLFDRHIALIFLEKLKDIKYASVTHVSRSKKVKKKPTPMNTIDLQKLASKKLHFSAAKTMEVAEKLYNKGLISYPRTETNQFSATIDLVQICKAIAAFKGKQPWCKFSKKLISPSGQKNLFSQPRHGKLNDNAHPPIHPVKHPES